jgi:peptide/nickel transport system substrate-binding protein
MRRLGFTLLIGCSLFLSPIAQAETLRVAVSAFAPTLGNPFSGTSQPSAELWLSIYDNLTRLGWSGGPEPSLALSWENTSPNTWVFKLRPNVVYHNGKSFTAQDVVDLLALIKQPDMARFLIPAELRGVAGGRVIDDLTVEIETIEPDAILPNRLATLMIIDPTLWAEMGIDTYTLEPIGTGPYKLTGWGSGNRVAFLEANPRSWRAPVEIDAVEYRLVPDKTSRIQGLISGQLDLITGLHVDDAETLKIPGIEVNVQANPQVKSIALPNALHEAGHPLNDKRVRQALNHAVDKQSIADLIMFGYAEVASQGLTSVTFGYNPALKPYAYDPVRARALLAEAGYPNGFPLTIEVVTDSTTPDGFMYQKVAQDIDAIGVDVTLRSIPYSDYQRKYTLSDWGDADAFHLIWNNAAFQDPIRPIEYFSCMRINAFFCEPDLMEDIKASSRELDRAKREVLLQNIMARYQDLAPAIWITNAVYTTAYTSRIANMAMRPTGVVFEELRLAP